MAKKAKKVIRVTATSLARKLADDDLKVFYSVIDKRKKKGKAENKKSARTLKTATAY